ncbi:MAG: hypothetical protein ABFR47_04360 [Verrucomicrobiota bacterium]
MYFFRQKGVAAKLRLFGLFGLFAGVLVVAGCATTSMKGTPFYTGEYEVREGSASDRVNLWPLAYYRDPALSVLWPFMEFSPDHLAFRPVYSVYGRQSGTPVYNVMWPLAKFDTANHANRIFPVYWGDDYCHVVPLYWHGGDPFSGVGYNTFFPFWMWNRTEDGSSLDVMYPFYAKYRFPDHQMRRVWPLYGTERRGEQTYRFYAWPFAHSYSTSKKAGQMVLPLYWHERTGNYSRFMSLPYSRGLSGVPGAKSWDLALPLWYRQWEGDSYYWEVYPTLSWGHRDSDKLESWYALGLGHRMQSPDRRSHHAIPFYYYGKDAESRQLYTLPWWSRAYSDGTGWNALLPFYYRSRMEGSSAFYSLPWLSEKRLDGSEWQASFPFYYYGKDAESRRLYTLPWWFRAYSDGTGWNALLPFYYRSQMEDSSVFYSLPWLSGKRSDGSEWQASFPFYYRSASTNGSITLTPLYAHKRQANGSTAWRCFVPLVYLDETYDAHFLTLLGGRWRMGAEHHWLALPLLSGGVWDADSGRNLWLAGLAGKRWQGDEKSHYVFPFYYAAPHAGAFVSLPYAAWRNGEGQNHAVPLLLSGWYSDGEASGSVLLAGLAGHRKGGEDAYHYFLPFYYSAPRKGTFLSLPYAAWNVGDRRNFAVPLLLSGKSIAGDETETALLGGLACWKKDANELRRSHVLPFYLWAKDDYLYTVLYGKNRTLSYYATPLVGRYDGEGGSGSWAFPFYWYRREASGEVWKNYLLLGHYHKNESHSEYGVYGLYDHRRWETSDDSNAEQRVLRKGRDVDYLFFLGEVRERWEYSVGAGSAGGQLATYSKTHLLPLLWEQSIDEKAETGERLETSALLGFLYDSRHEKKTAEAEHDYLRRRVLWRLYHSEKLNGDKSTDVFPGITVDSYKNGYFKCSFLWRMFRYEKNPETGEKNLDLLFIPIRRSKSE